MPKDAPYSFEKPADFKKRMKKKGKGRMSAGDQGRALRFKSKKGGPSPDEMEG